jgi:ATP-binding cassette subfamily B (MDR/TAP) protein 9
MSTVRAFDAAESELKEFETYMEKYMRLNIRAAVAYVGYSSCVTALPQLVTALVVFYGGLIVRNGDMTSGELVSFLLYLSSLSDAFANIGYIFSSLTQAVGAADKVFELMHRKPRIKTSSREPPNLPLPRGFLGVVAKKTVTQRHAGMHPATCRGEITLENVDLCYPARPQRRILNGISLKIPAGSVVALVGQSGGGKSSVMSLLQHLYEPSAGKVLIDEYEVSTKT